MAFIPVENVALFEIRYRLDGQKVENTLYCERLAGWDVTAMGDAAAIIRTTLVEPLLVFQTENLVWQEIQVTDLTAFDATQMTYLGTGVIPGDVSEEQLPNNCAWVVKFNTNTRGRSYRGRNYVPGLTVVSVTANTLDTSNAGSIVDAYQQTFDDLAAADYIPVVVSRYNAGAPRVAGVATPIVSVSYTDLTLDSQRRRLPGRGD